jgi:hypothetical protein
MYSPALGVALRAVGIEARTAAEAGVSARPDPDVFATAVANGAVLLTENVSDFARISAEHLTAGRHHAGVLVALSSRSSRRPAGIAALVEAIAAVADERLDDRVVYLEPAG